MRNTLMDGHQGQAMPGSESTPLLVGGRKPRTAPGDQRRKRLEQAQKARRIVAVLGVTAIAILGTLIVVLPISTMTFTPGMQMDTGTFGRFVRARSSAPGTTVREVETAHGVENDSQVDESPATPRGQNVDTGQPVGTVVETAVDSAAAVNHAGTDHHDKGDVNHTDDVMDEVLVAHDGSRQAAGPQGPGGIPHHQQEGTFVRMSGVEKFDEHSAVRQQQQQAGNGGGSKPNVFLIMVDDMGWNDIGYLSTDLSEFTPNLDRIAAGGVKLSNYYGMHVCTPARASLMTGRYTVRYGMEYGVIKPGAPWGLPLSEKVMPQYMNEAGYESHMVGKWHLGGYSEDVLPHRRGFRTFLGYLNGIEEYWTHKNVEFYLDDKNFHDLGWGNETDYYSVTVNGTAEDPLQSNGNKDVQSTVTSSGINNDPYLTDPNTMAYVTDDKFPEDGNTYGYGGIGDSTEDPLQFSDNDEGGKNYDGVYSEDVFVDRAIRVVADKTPWDEEPLFLYLAHQSVHSPISLTPEGDFTSEEMALLSDLNVTSPMRMGFAGALMYLDKKIGQLLDALEAGGWMENSIIVLHSDNGGCSIAGGSTYPYRGGKQSMFEGGTKVPAFVYSKSHLPAESQGATYDGLMHITDWLPTLASAVGAELSGSAGPLDGIDHWSFIEAARPERFEGLDSLLHGDFLEESGGPRKEMLYNWDPYMLSSSGGNPLTRNDSLVQGAFRKGKWKLIMNSWCNGYATFDPEIQGDPLLDADAICPRMTLCNECADSCQDYPETYGVADWLFDLEADPRETHNRIHDFPEIATRLRRRAHKVVFSEFHEAIVQDASIETFIQTWLDNDWWMVPWLGTTRVDYDKDYSELESSERGVR